MKGNSHRPIVWDLHGNFRSTVQVALVSPKAFPVNRMDGPVPMPGDVEFEKASPPPEEYWDWEAWKAGHVGRWTDPLDCRLAFFFHWAEQELLDYFGLRKHQDKYVGREDGAH